MKAPRTKTNIYIYIYIERERERETYRLICEYEHAFTCLLLPEFKGMLHITNDDKHASNAIILIFCFRGTSKLHGAHTLPIGASDTSTGPELPKPDPWHSHSAKPLGHS